MLMVKRFLARAGERWLEQGLFEAKRASERSIRAMNAATSPDRGIELCHECADLLKAIKAASDRLHKFRMTHSQLLVES